MSKVTELPGKGKTIGAQTVSLCSLNLPANSCAIIEMMVGGLSDDNLAGGATRKIFVKKIAGVVTIIGDFEILVLKGDAGLAGATIQAIVTGGAIEFQVTGVATKTINWSAFIRIYAHY